MHAGTWVFTPNCYPYVTQNDLQVRNEELS